MSTPFRLSIDPKIAERIAQSIAHLEVPSEALILAAYADMRRQCEIRRRALLEEMERAKIEGEAALARILLSPDDIKNLSDADYFNR